MTPRYCIDCVYHVEPGDLCNNPEATLQEDLITGRIAPASCYDERYGEDGTCGKDGRNWYPK